MPPTQRCARPGCGGVATAWLSYDYAGQRVWLDDPGADSAGHHSALCAAHAGRLRPPQGWSCQDRRTVHTVRAPAPPRPRPGADAADAPPEGGEAPASAAAPPATRPTPLDEPGPGPEGGRPPGFTAVAV